MGKKYYNKEFWEYLDKLINGHKIIIDRRKNSYHPKYKDIIYPIDYGYIEGTTSMDGEGIDVFVGSDNEKVIDSVAITIDLWKNDSEIKILVGCSKEEKDTIFKFLNKHSSMKCIIIER